jgi:Flp pilus assembly protein TadG
MMFKLLRDFLHRSFTRLTECVRGIAAIEFAFITPVLILMSIAVFDLGQGAYRDMQVQNAAQAGAEYAIAHGFNANSISNAVKSATSFAGIGVSQAPSQFCGCASSTGISNVSCNSTCSSCNSTCSNGLGPGTYVTVSAQGTYTTMIPYPMMPSSFTFNAQSTARIQ